MKLNDYKRVMGRLTVSDALAERLKSGKAVVRTPKTAVSHRPRFTKVLSVAATIATLALVIAAFVLIVRFIGPERPIDIPSDDSQNDYSYEFKLMSVSTYPSKAISAEFLGYDYDEKCIKIKWSGINGSVIKYNGDLTLEEYVNYTALEIPRSDNYVPADTSKAIQNGDEVIFDLDECFVPIDAGHYVLTRPMIRGQDPVNLTVEFSLVDKNDTSEAGFELISSSSDHDDVSVDFVGYEPENKYLTLNWLTSDTQSLYLKDNSYSMYYMRDGKWKLVEGSFMPSTTTADPPYDVTSAPSEWYKVSGDKLFYLAKFLYGNSVVGYYKLVIPFAVQDASLTTPPRDANGSVTIEFRLNSKAVIDAPENIPAQRLNDGPGDYRADILGGIVCDHTGLPYVGIEIQSYNIFTNTVEVKWSNSAGNEITLSDKYVIKKLVNGIWTADWTAEGRAEFHVPEVKISVDSYVHWEVYEIPTSADGSVQGRYRIEREVINGDIRRIAVIPFELTGEYSGLSFKNFTSGVPGVKFSLGSYGKEFPELLEFYVYNGSESTLQLFSGYSIYGYHNGEWTKLGSNDTDSQALKSGAYSIAKKVSLNDKLKIDGSYVVPSAYKVEMIVKSDDGITEKLSMEIWTSDASEKYSNEFAFIGFESTEPYDMNGQHIAGIELEYIGFEHRNSLLSRSFIKYRLTNNSAYPLYYSKDNGISVLRNDYWTQIEESPISDLNAKYTELAPGESVELNMYCNDYLLSQLPVGVYELETCYYINDPNIAAPIYYFVTCRYAVGEGVGMSGDGACVVADISNNNGNMSTYGRLTRVVGASYDKNSSRLTFRAINSALSYKIMDAAVSVYKGADFGNETVLGDIVGKKYQPGVENEFSFTARSGETVRLRWVISAVGSDGTGYIEERIVVFKID